MIESITHCGELFHDCAIPGETRADGVYPGNCNGTQVSRDRFLFVHSTRGFRGVDNDRSVAYQLRRDSYTGPVITEGILAHNVDDWDVQGDGILHNRVFGHPVVFGVPKGAIIDGGPAPNANVFVIKFRCNPRQVDDQGFLVSVPGTPPEFYGATHVRWIQVRLNNAEDDIEIIQPMQEFRTADGRGYRDVLGEDIAAFTQALPSPAPVTPAATQWADCAYFEQGCLGYDAGKKRMAIILQTWNGDTGRYEWTDTGPIFGPGFEGCLVPYGNDWAISVRTADGPTVPWYRFKNLLAEPEGPFRQDQPRIVGPRSAYCCADGVIRLFTSPIDEDPGTRNPLRVWDIDPDDGFKMTREYLVCDVRKETILDELPHAEHAKLMPHTGGDTQILIHRIRNRYTLNPRLHARTITPEEMEVCGTYYARIKYDREYPGVWSFA